MDPPSPCSGRSGADLQHGAGGSQFTWRSQRSGARREVACRLLGRHTALNVAAGLAAVECVRLPLASSLVVVRARNGADLQASLREGGLDPERVHLVDSLELATRVLAGLTRPNAVVLFCNDLPGTYLEASPARGYHRRRFA